MDDDRRRTRPTFEEDWTTLCTLARAWATTAPMTQREREKRETEELIRRVDAQIDAWRRG